MRERDEALAAAGRSRRQPALDPGLDLDAARFFLALGAVGEVSRAAELAGVPLDRAVRWSEQVDRPAWMTRRGEAAARLFQVANEALDRTRRVLRGQQPGENEPPCPPLRDLVLVAERFYGAAMKLDRHVGSNGDAKFEIILDDGPAADGADSAPAAPSGAAGGAGL